VHHIFVPEDKAPLRSVLELVVVLLSSALPGCLLYHFF
jgi:hypothetical protein